MRTLDWTLTARRGARLLVRASAVAAFLGAMALPARAQTQVDGYVEGAATRTHETNQITGGPQQRTDLDGFIQRLNFTVSQPLWPNLRVMAGGFFERLTTDGTLYNLDVDAATTRLRPFALVRLDSQTIRAEFGWDRNETRNRSDSFRERLVRDSWHSSLAWFPTTADYIQLQLFKSDDRDTENATVNRTIKSALVTSQVHPIEPVMLQLRTSLDRTDDRLHGFEVESLNDNLRVNYGQQFWNRRITVGSDYNVTWTRVDTTSRPLALVDLRLFPIAGLSSINDVPDRDPLNPTPSLIDSDRLGSTGINIGQPPVGGDVRLRNFGVDFGVPTTVNFLRVWVDRDVRIEISSWFTWDIWTSDDNLRWTHRQTISNAPFGPFENHFDLRFNEVTSRFVKVTVRPLPQGLQYANEYPLLQITELETFHSVPGQTIEGTTRGTQQNFTLDTRVLLLEVPTLYYDFNFLLNDISDGPRRTGVVNAFTLSQPLGPVWSMLARVGNEQGEDPRGHHDLNFYSASFNANPAPTLHTGLLFSGRRERFGDSRDNTDTGLASVNATLYRGIDLNGNVGVSVFDDEVGRRSTTRLANIGLQFVPNRIVTVSLNYQDASRTLSGAGLPRLDDPNRSFEFGVTLSPLRTLYLFGSYRTENRTDLGHRNLHTYNVSWSPFPYGTLRFNFLFNEFYESDLETLTRVWGPSVRWNVSRRSYLDVGYQSTSTDSIPQQTDRSVSYVTLRIGF